MDEIRQKITDALLGISQNPLVKGYLVVRRDGLPILTTLDSSFDTTSVSALSASLLGSFELLSERLGEGTAEHIVIETDTSKIIALGGPLAILLIIAASKLEAGEIIAFAKASENQIEKILA